MPNQTVKTLYEDADLIIKQKHEKKAYEKYIQEIVFFSVPIILGLLTFPLFFQGNGLGDDSLLFVILLAAMITILVALISAILNFKAFHRYRKTGITDFKLFIRILNNHLPLRSALKLIINQYHLTIPFEEENRVKLNGSKNYQEYQCVDPEVIRYPVTLPLQLQLGDKKLTIQFQIRKNPEEPISLVPEELIIVLKTADKFLDKT